MYVCMYVRVFQVFNVPGGYIQSYMIWCSSCHFLHREEEGDMVIEREGGRVIFVTPYAVAYTL